VITRPGEEETTMSRQDIENEIIETMGQVPDFFAAMPDYALESSWQDFKAFQLGDTELSAREKQLIGYAVAAAIHCPCCTYFHRSATKMMGMSDQQLEEEARVAADTARYSTYLHGLGTDLEEFKRETDEIGEYLSTHQVEAESEAA
jgi:AhpD family alkylhydroperoxidase